MALNFPHNPEIRLERPPLVEVVCQVRFPVILRIAREEPSEFQELIRRRFPLLEMEQSVLVQFPGLSGEGAPVAEAQAKIYRFRTPDTHTSISLAVDFFALSTDRYTHWEDFAQDLRLAHEAVQQVYQPPYATRIGLRYVNRLTLANTGGQSVAELLDLVRPELTALLRGTAWSDPENMLCQLVLTDGQAKLTLRTGYGEEQDEPFFLLDLDYFEDGELPLTGLPERTRRYHDTICDAFRWCLPDESLSRFAPIVEEASRP